MLKNGSKEKPIRNSKGVNISHSRSSGYNFAQIVSITF